MPAGGAANDVLAEEIATALVAAGLVAPARRAELERGLAGGTLKDRDWRVLIETMLASEEGGDERTA